MTSRFDRGGTANNNMRPQQYPNGFGGEDDESDAEVEAPPSYAATLESVKLGRDAENKQILDQVDQLRECRVDELIDLPQIVVVGDQSTGKSSVLESLTKIPFPTNSVKCTRYATQIRLRREDQVRTGIDIIPAKGSSSDERKRLAAFKQIVDQRADWETIFEQAMETIFPPGSQHSFLSRHILSIQVSGPTQPHLTVVDLPGIIHAATQEQTENDKVAITALAKEYMEKERTIILPVVSGSNDISNQAVLQMVKEIDRKGVRTLGIITKPDMTLTEPRELEFINLALNKDKRNKLQLGWHVLRNRAHDEGHFTPEQRDRTEKEFFAGSNWGKKLGPAQLGVDALSKRLSTQLIRHIAAEVFKVKDEINRELQKCREKLGELGEGKDTPEEMRTEIYRWSERSLRLTQAAIQGHGINPSGEDFFPSFDDGKLYARNFRSRVVKQNKIFTDLMEDRGSAWLIINEGEPRMGKSSSKSGDNGTQVREISRGDYLKKIVQPLIQDNPGQELSMDTNPLLVYRLFQSYSENWITHATQHISNVHKLCEEYLNQVLQFVWPKRIQYRVWGGFIQSQINLMRDNAKEELGKIKADRMKLVTAYESDFEKKWYEQKDLYLANQAAVDPTQQKYEDLLRKMLLYYDCNLSKFTTNIIVQIVERHIVDGLEKVFKDERVRKLEDHDVKLMVEDDYNIRTERKELRDHETILSKGEEICRQISMRSDLGPYEYQDPNLQPSARAQVNGNTHNGNTHKSRAPPQRYAYPSEPSSSNHQQSQHTPQQSTDSGGAQPSPRTPNHPAPPIPTSRPTPRQEESYQVYEDHHHDSRQFSANGDSHHAQGRSVDETDSFVSGHREPVLVREEQWPIDQKREKKKKGFFKSGS